MALYRGYLAKIIDGQRILLGDSVEGGCGSGVGRSGAEWGILGRKRLRRLLSFVD